MTDSAGPFDGTPWSEAQWARFAALWSPSGVVGTPAASTAAGDLALSLSGLSVGLGAGRAWVHGFGFERTGAAAMQAVAANTHASFFRRDRIVLRRNLAAHTVTPVLLTGTPASAPPAPPALTQSETGSWDVPMFSFLVPPNSGTSITGVIDERAWLDPVTGVLVLQSGLLTPVAGWSGTVAGEGTNYDPAAYTLDSNGRVELSGMLGRNGANVVVTSTPVAVAALPASIVPDHNVAPLSYFGPGSPAQTVMGRFFVGAGNASLKFLPIDAGSYTVYSGSGFINLDGVGWNL